MDATWTAPKNIRQIGETNAHYSIYIEDYVSTYIGQFAREMGGACAQGLLLGQIIPEEEKTVYVIRGILTDQENYPSREMLFSQEAMDGLYKQKESYFPDMDVIGEVIFDKEYPYSLGEKLIDTVRLGQLAQMPGIRPLFLHMDYSDKTLAFYIGSQGAVEIVESYYIFYDKNEAMQNYLIRYNEEAQRRVEEIHDVISFKAREAMEGPRKIRFHLEKENVMTCAVCMLLVCVALLGIVHINQYQKMNQLEDSLNHAVAFFAPESQADVPASANAALDAGTGDGEDLYSSLPIYRTDGSADNREKQDGTPDGQKGEAAGGGQNGSATSGAQNGDAASGDQSGDAASGEPDGEAQAAASNENGQKDDTDVANPDEGTQAEASNTGGQTEDKPAGAEPLREYIVQKGDTLTSISLLFYQDRGMIDAICRLNEIKDADRISVGQKILLP